jgi:hypothetical protein
MSEFPFTDALRLVVIKEHKQETTRLALYRFLGASSGLITVYLFSGPRLVSELWLLLYLLFVLITDKAQLDQYYGERFDR